MADPLANVPALVIGGLGFIGSNLTARLASRGARVTVLTPARERHDDLAKAFERQDVRVVEGDVRDQGLMLELVGDQALIFNLSGQSGAVRSMEDPWTDLDVNCRGTLTVLESMRAKNPRAKVVFAGSRLQYGKPPEMPVAEDSPRDARSLHAIHKQTVEEYFRLYGRLFGIRFSWRADHQPIRPGSEAWPDRLRHHQSPDPARASPASRSPSTATARSFAITCMSTMWCRRCWRWRNRPGPTAASTTSAAAPAADWSTWRRRS